MTIDDYFKEYIEICDDIRSMAIELKVRKDDLYSLSGITYEQSSKGTNHNGIDFLISKIADMEHMIESKEKQKQERYIKELKVIDQLEDKRERLIIKMFYLDRMSIGQIASILYISESHLKRIKSSAVKHFEKMIPNDT